MSIRLASLVMLGSLLFIAGCAQQTPAPDVSSNEARVKVNVEGRLFLNGVETSLEDLKAEFARLKAVGGHVLYYRERPEAEPPQIAGAVIMAIVEAELPVQFVERDFS